MYLWYTTSIHKLSIVISFHPTLAARYLTNDVVFYIPHPAKNLGLEIWSHFTQGRTFCSLFHVHKNFEEFFRDFSKMDFGIHAKDIQ